MIEEQFVSFDTAKMLKEAGFEANLKTRYVEEEKDDWAFWDSGTKRSDYNYFDDVIACPTQALAARWLRDVHKIDVTVIPCEDGCYAVDILHDKHRISSSSPFEGGYEEALETGLQEAIKLIKK